QEALRTKHLFQYRPEHEQGKHIEENMGNATVHEHVRDDLPDVESGRIGVVHAEEVVCPRKNQRTSDETDYIDDEQILYYRRHAGKWRYAVVEHSFSFLF